MSAKYLFVLLLLSTLILSASLRRHYNLDSVVIHVGCCLGEHPADWKWIEKVVEDANRRNVFVEIEFDR